MDVFLTAKSAKVKQDLFTIEIVDHDETLDVIVTHEEGLRECVFSIVKDKPRFS